MALRRRSHLQLPRQSSMPSPTLQSHKDRRYSIRERVSSPRPLWSAPTTSFGHSHNLPDDYGPEKKSIIGKVKDKAKKWRQLLAKKRNKQADDNPTPPSAVNLEEADDDEDDLNHCPPPKHESETEVGTDYYCPSPPTIRYPSPVAHRETEMKQANDAIKTAPKSESAVSNNEYASVGGYNESAVSNNESATVGGNNGSAMSSKSSSDDQLAVPAVVSAASQVMVARIQQSRPRCETAARQIWDKGLWMKEYLLQKLEPGEGDRALCEVITEAVSPRKTTSFTSLTELQGHHTNRDETAQQEKAESPLPISTNPHPAEVEVAGGREVEAYESKRCSA